MDLQRKAGVLLVEEEKTDAKRKNSGVLYRQ